MFKLSVGTPEAKSGAREAIMLRRLASATRHRGGFGGLASDHRRVSSWNGVGPTVAVQVRQLEEICFRLGRTCRVTANGLVTGARPQ